jgi:hypothetical protein
VSDSFIIDALNKGNKARFINHSCDPNCESQKWNVSGITRIALVAKRDLPKGTEFTYDYNFDYNWVGSGNDQPCYCGASNCSGIFGKKARTADNYYSSSSSSSGSSGSDDDDDDDDEVQETEKIDGRKKGIKRKRVPLQRTFPKKSKI